MGLLNLHCDVAEKVDGTFTEADEEAILALADQAADTIRSERRFQPKPTSGEGPRRTQPVTGGLGARLPTSPARQGRGPG
jgi:hypothetical protein